MKRFRALVVLLAIASSTIAVVPAAAQPRPSRRACAHFAGPLCSLELPTGVRMRYLDIGPSDGPVAVLLHGFADSVQSWSLVLPRLRRLMPWERFLIPDLRGHGGTTQPPSARCAPNPDECFRPVDYARDVVALLNAEHITRAALIGHSVGTLVAQEIALDHPDRVTSLVLISTAADGQEPAVQGVQSEVVQGEWRQAFTTAGYTWPAGVYAVNPGVAVSDFTNFIDNEFETSAIAAPALLTRLQAGARMVKVGTWIGTLDDLVIADNNARLRRLSVPTLVLWAVQDDIFSPANERQLINDLNDAARHGTSFWWKKYGVLLPPASGAQTDLGHNLPWEVPVGVAADTAAFFKFGAPTCTLYRSDFPTDIHRVRAIPNRAKIVHAGAGPNCLGARRHAA